MTRVGATEFKAKCLELMDRVAEGRARYEITKRGRPVAQLVPVEAEPARSVLGCMAGEMEIVGDLVASSMPDAAWQTLARGRAARLEGRGGASPRRRTVKRARGGSRTPPSLR